MDWISDPKAWIGLLTLTILEIVLGIDNIVFISIVAGKLPPAQQRPAWRWGLILALIPRMVLLLFLGVLLRMTHPLFTVFGSPTEHNPWAISGKDLILIVGGLFLVFKATREIHGKLEGESEEVHARGKDQFGAVLVQIMMLNLVFSIDSVVTAIGMVDKIPIMAGAVIISTFAMIAVAQPVGDFVEKHPTVKMLALSFLVLIGANLLAEGFGQHIPKGYTYFAMAFSVGVEMINLRLRKATTTAPVKLHEPHLQVPSTAAEASTPPPSSPSA
ncbi:MAG: TerC family protein [Deltaproteobacteria bacterium]|nr:TerC family protein [Deltaproteobacteria bacterium]MBK8696565.1 TerC family protein [Deltaproteobacteria bacterium]MBP6833834.1 TerC family protein [Deltaproteobacteria bacterium]